MTEEASEKNASGSSIEPKKAPQNHQRKVLTALAFIVVLGLFSYGFYWVGWGQYSENTDDAYVSGNMVIITPQVEGVAVAILADNTQLVEAGQPLVELDRNPFRIALEKAQADLGEAVRRVVQMFIKVDELIANLEVKKAAFTKASQDFEHRRMLVADGSVSIEEFEHSHAALNIATATLKEAEMELGAAVAAIKNTTIKTHPLVEQAKSVLKSAYLALHRCVVVSPVRGIVSQRSVQVGENIGPQKPIMAVIPLDQMWVDANFREVSLENLRIGQPVTMISDMYGKSVVYKGKVVGLNPGTGGVFSILPPQNASGNWIKIIQRLAVKISLDQKELQESPLFIGLSMNVSVDTHNRENLQIPKIPKLDALYTSDVYEDELNGAEELIEKIIKENSVDILQEGS